MSVDFPNESLRDLDAIRLDHDWSFSDLSDHMAAAGFPVAGRTLHYLLKGSGGAVVHAPRDRTLYKIGQYIVWQHHQDDRRTASNARRRSKRRAIAQSQTDTVGGR